VFSTKIFFFFQADDFYSFEVKNTANYHLITSDFFEQRRKINFLNAKKPVEEPTSLPTLARIGVLSLLRLRFSFHNQTQNK